MTVTLQGVVIFLVGLAMLAIAGLGVVSCVVVCKVGINDSGGWGYVACIFGLAASVAITTWTVDNWDKNPSITIGRKSPKLPKATVVK